MNHISAKVSAVTTLNCWEKGGFASERAIGEEPLPVGEEVTLSALSEGIEDEA